MNSFRPNERKTEIFAPVPDAFTIILVCSLLTGIEMDRHYPSRHLQIYGILYRSCRILFPLCPENNVSHTMEIYFIVKGEKIKNK